MGSIHSFRGKQRKTDGERSEECFLSFCAAQPCKALPIVARIARIAHPTLPSGAASGKVTLLRLPLLRFPPLPWWGCLAPRAHIPQT